MRILNLILWGLLCVCVYMCFRERNFPSVYVISLNVINCCAFAFNVLFLHSHHMNFNDIQCFCEKKSSRSYKNNKLLLLIEEYLPEQIYNCFCKEWVYFTLSASKGKVNGQDVSFLLCVKHALFCAVEIYGVEDKAGAIPRLLSTTECKCGPELICQK